MEWSADVSAGDWIRERVGPGLTGDMHGFVPRGFAAYARVFHPATRDRPVGRSWPPVPYERHRAAWEAFEASRPEIDVEPVGWAETAAAFGGELHPLAQWHRLALPDAGGAEDGPRDAAGWRYSAPPAGQLDPGVLAALARVLTASTTTPDDGFVGLWDGHGGLVGGMGYGPSRVLLTAVEEAAPEPGAARHLDFLAHSARDRFNSVFARPTWQPGILPDEVSRGPRLSLPGREHVLFRGGVRELADPAWPDRVPWRDDALHEHGFAASAVSPSIVWPADRAWVVATDVDLDSTIVGGSADLVRTIVAAEGVEALPVPVGARLDEVRE